MDFELRRAREKLEKEQRARKEKARLKLERERKSKQEAARQRDAIEAAQRSRRLDAANAQLKSAGIDRLKGLSEHESLCGSRTAPCDSCWRSVMLKETDIHRIAVHQKN